MSARTKSTATPKIAMQGVTKSFGDKQVLRGIDIEVAPEESLAIIGTSGCGKSVTLKCLLGLLRADGGSIRVDGTEMIGASRQQLEDMRRRFGMTFQFGALFDSSADLGECDLPAAPAAGDDPPASARHRR